jgi:hypothetical protein
MMQNQRSLSTSTIPRSISRQIDGDPFTIHERQRAIQSVKYRFWWFSVVASLNHALNYVVTSYATSLLDPRLGGIILGLNWILNSVSGLTVSTPAVKGLGFKYSMLVSLIGYAIQVGTLYWAVVTSDPLTAYITSIIGSTIAGFTSAIWWTSQGVYFEYICTCIDAILTSHDYTEKSKIDEVRAEMAAHWTFIYQFADILVFLSLSVFPLIHHVSIRQVLFGLTIVGIITSFLGLTFESIPSDARQVTWSDLKTAILAVPKQFIFDARVSLLSPFVFGFGITTAMFSYYVNSSVVSDSESLGTVTLGFLEAFSYFIAIISAYPYSYVSNTMKRGQDWVIQFGSLAFLTCGLVVLVLNDQQLGTWQNILFAKGLYGLGRGVFEGSCRAVYAKMFSGEDLSTAFSGQTLAAGFSGGICFFLFGILDRTAISAVTVVNGLIAISTYFIIMYGIDPLRRVSWGKVCSLCCCGLCGVDETDGTQTFSSAVKYESVQSLTEEEYLESLNPLQQQLIKQNVRKS